MTNGVQDMKIIGASVRDTADGREITVTGLVAKTDALDGTEAEQLMSLLGEMDTDEPQEPAPAPTPGRRSRGAAGAATSQEPAPASAATQPSEPASGRRRHGAQSTEEAPANPTPEAPRRRRGSEGAAAASAAGTAPQAAPTAEAPRRRRTGNAAPAEEVSDADLVKAASEAAEEITPALVMQILAEDFNGAKLVTDLHGADRRKFLDTLKAEVEAQAD